MGLFQGANNLIPASGGGGGIIGTNTEVINNRNFTLTTGLDQADTAFSVTTGGGFTNATSGSGTGTTAPRVSLRGDNSASVTTLAQNFISDISSSANNNVYQTVLNDTAGGGVFYWASAWADHDNSLTSATTTNRTVTQTVSLRITIDGGTPIEFVGERGTGTSTAGANNTMNSSSAIFLGYPLLRESNYSYISTAGISGESHRIVTTPIFRDFDHTTISGIDGIEVTNAVIRQPGSSTNSVVSDEVAPLGYNSEILIKNGIPGIRYNTSLLVEARYNATRSGSTNNRSGDFSFSVCAEQF